MREASPPRALSLLLRCQCGSCALRLALDRPPPALRCHCARCRRYHSSAFAAFLQIGARAPALASLSPSTRTHPDVCDAMGPVDRLSCLHCYSVLAWLPSSGEAGVLLSLGCVDDSSIPPPIAREWARRYAECEPTQRARWWTAVPRQPAAPSVRTLRGGCACGACAFEAQSGGEFQTQHCYCKLCRRLSGSVGQTWVPVRPEGFRWRAKDALRLVRTTAHGQRHVCTRCGGVLSIVYDSQPDCIWPSAGVLDDASLPEDIGAALCRSIHICCSMMQAWYELPDDGLPRLKYAG
ncbi:hypothetical protein AB1Y20_006855 [Prymnesium parvum]|uniref:CENP-V/GFA domain-containing protein n=1 Tax=Prymnesium parvum TaxID=97485 RepID=A0AB34IYT6_PRYPA